MTSKTISLRHEAYERLKKLKGDDKSFSEVVMELTEKSRKDFSNLLGSDLDLEWGKIEESRMKSKEDEDRERLLSGH